jgi:hypothetical protein
MLSKCFGISGKCSAVGDAQQLIFTIYSQFATLSALGHRCSCQRCCVSSLLMMCYLHLARSLPLLCPYSLGSPYSLPS